MRPLTLVFFAVPTLVLASFHHNLKNVTARDMIQKPRLEPNIEESSCQNFIDSRTLAGTHRSISTVIYYLLEDSVGFLYWHRTDDVQAWYVSWSTMPFPPLASRNWMCLERRWHT
jgi:predicted cupin superfamily sugar epimerase